MEIKVRPDVALMEQVLGNDTEITKTTGNRGGSVEMIKGCLTNI